MRKLQTGILVLVAQLLLFGASGAVGDRLNARDLFIKQTGGKDNLPRVPAAGSAADAQPIAAVEHLGLRYRVLLVDKDTNRTQAVDPNRMFHSGECVALELEANRAGYLFVLAKTSEGQWQPLFPSPEMHGESEVVSAHTLQRVPQNYCFELDNTPGEEDLYLILSRDPAQASDLHLAFLDRQDFQQKVQPALLRLKGRDFELTKVGAGSDAPDAGSVYVVPAQSSQKDTVFAEIVIKHQ